MPPTPLRILVVEGNIRAYNVEKVKWGGASTAEHYAAVLEGLGEGDVGPVACTIIRPANADDPGLPANMALTDFHGVAWTGSGLNIYNAEPEAMRQVDLARAAMAARVPVFGSCWGLQVATVAAGGTVRRNPKGREIGFARRIVRAGEGLDHPMFAGKPLSFDAVSVHLDEVETRPPGMAVLASNHVSEVQAAVIRDAAGRELFWGVQYHPEYGLRDAAASVRRVGDSLIRDGLFTDREVIERFAADLRTLDADPSRRDLAWLYGVDTAVLDPALRHAELRNWLRHLRAP